MILRRAALADTWSDGQRTAVFVGSNVITLSPMGSVILEAVPEGASVTLDEVAAAAVDAFGSPEEPLDPRDIVAEQAGELAAHGVLVLTDAE
ncbi:MAG: hypothetical protein ACI379_07645 [Nocardioides sp.]|uniref:hypothetical protein n=1 Tax=Nocardioides sp. TaxID=35761 RepID=UPI003F02D759